MLEPQQGSRPAAIPPWLVWTVAALGLFVLLQQLQGALVLFMRSPINPDVHGFIADARRMRAFYDCPSREPLQVLWFKVGLWLSDDTELVARMTTLIQTLLAGLLLFLFGRRFFGSVTGLASLFLFAVNPIVRYYGVSGMRAPLFSALLLLFGLWLFDTWRRRDVQSVLAGIAGALLILTRVYAYAIVAGAFVIYFLHARGWRAGHRRPCARHLLIAGLTIAFLVGPDLIFRPASPIHGQTVNFWRNLEFHGDPGTWQTDPPGSHFQYLFGDHSLPEVVLRVAGNYALYAYQYLPHFMRGYGGLWWLLPVGIGATFFHRREFVAGLWVLSLSPVVFVLSLNQVPGALGIENRYVFQAYPLALLLVLHGLFFTAERALGVAASRCAALGSLRWRLRQALLPTAGWRS